MPSPEMEHATKGEEDIATDKKNKNKNDNQKTAQICTLSLNGVTVEFSSLGASITKLLLPNGNKEKNDEEQSTDDCVLGFETPTQAIETKNPVFFGTIVGRVANRIANSKFHLMQPSSLLSEEEEENNNNPPTKKKKETYHLAANNDPHHLHGGPLGFSHRIWKAIQKNQQEITFTLTSQDGDEGYPATIHVTATYKLTSITSTKTTKTSSFPSVSLQLTMHASLVDSHTSQKSTPVNLAQHTYFNLAGHDAARGILDHVVHLPSTHYTPTDAFAIPTREVRSLDQDPCMDFRGTADIPMAKALVEYVMENTGFTSEQAMEYLDATRDGKDFATSGNGGIKSGTKYGFDHNYVIRHQEEAGEGLHVAGTVTHVDSGRKLTVLTDAPGVQFYTGNYLDGTLGGCKSGVKYGQWQGLCLETQHFPDSIDCQECKEDDDETASPEFGKGACVILKPGGRDYVHNVEYRFDFFRKPEKENS